MITSLNATNRLGDLKRIYEELFSLAGFLAHERGLTTLQLVQRTRRSSSPAQPPLRTRLLHHICPFNPPIVNLKLNNNTGLNNGY